MTDSVGRHRWQVLRWQTIRSLSLATALLLGGIAPARALVPYVYMPPTREMQEAGLGIAQAAARLLRMGQADDAARLAELTVRLLPDDPRGWVLLAEAQLRSNALSQAVVSLERAKQLDPTNAGIWFAEGSLALRNGKPENALALLRRGLELDPKSSAAYFDLGNAYILLNQFPAALTAFEKASSLRGDFWEAINNQGLVLFENDRRQDAIARWRRVLKLKPDVAETSLALAAALYSSTPANRAEALQLAETALAKDPNYVNEAFQKEQLWGPKLRSITVLLLADPALKAAVDRATANAGGSSDEDNEDP